LKQKDINRDFYYMTYQPEKLILAQGRKIRELIWVDGPRVDMACDMKYSIVQQSIYLLLAQGALSLTARARTIGVVPQSPAQVMSTVMA
jgi:hypothetical protein